MSSAINLTVEPPRSPRTRLSGYPLMARMIDKGRATLAGTAGEYHFACPLAQMLFQFKGVDAGDVRTLLGSGATDEAIATWFDSHGTPRSSEEIQGWSAGIEGYLPYQNPEKKDWFAGECVRLNLKPETTTLFDYLDTDDVATFKN